MELTNAQIALQAAVALTPPNNFVSEYSVTNKADVFLDWLNENTPQERVQDAR
jgi:hypothetical protein